MAETSNVVTWRDRAYDTADPGIITRAFGGITAPLGRKMLLRLVA